MCYLQRNLYDGDDDDNDDDDDELLYIVSQKHTHDIILVR